ncbi:NAD(P)-dependent oxidoreductase [Micractinium conductrix]|uniref:NAD(P)-dependent oxidoreductase n=1 Tax=Micractinium conductrix TaxID=554055 RepID=A0A2P6V8G9_9CHLO|nr:NAD(P)-dependent oxidoreductase [Micractinium conductrix]|eukprot:PSC70385.1 NAD(P)-dependent oxidoreductase [Micractinium conductrix]
MPSLVGAPSRPAAPRRAVPAAAWTALGKQHANRLFIFGLGYTGLGAATYFQQRGWEVAGTCRTQEKCERLARHDIHTHYFDPTEFNNLSGKGVEALRHATHVLSTVPPDADHAGDPVVMAHAQQLGEHAEEYRWVGYISSTSVYGDYEGEWVDEGSELRAADGKGWSRVMAEHEWLALHDQFGLPVHIFRCGGIYGPQRSALDAVQRAAAGGGGSASAARRAAQRYIARCHVFDICQTLEASMRHSRPGTAYNIADDDPADRATVMAYAAELLQRSAAGLPPPDGSWGLPTPQPSGAAVLAGVGGSDAASAASGGGGGGSSSGSLPELAEPLSSVGTATSSGSSYDSGDDALQQQGWRRGAGLERPRGGGGAPGRRLEEKRVRNARIKKELGVQLAFPTYREGLAGIAAGDLRPFER